jgi:hypothetical protein
MKREYIQQPSVTTMQQHELSHLMSMYPDSISSVEHQRMIHYQHNSSPDLQSQQQQQTLRMAPLAHMWDQFQQLQSSTSVEASTTILRRPHFNFHDPSSSSTPDIFVINRENGCVAGGMMDISAI